MLHIQQVKIWKKKLLSNEVLQKYFACSFKFQTGFTICCCRIFLLAFNEANNSHRGPPSQLRIGGQREKFSRSFLERFVFVLIAFAICRSFSFLWKIFLFFFFFGNLITAPKSFNLLLKISWQSCLFFFNFWICLPFFAYFFEFFVEFLDS